MTFQILIDRFFIYLKYYFKAKTIYHIQSPLLFDFISNVFDQDQSYYAFYTIDAAYDSISNSQKTIPTDEFSNSHQQNGKSLAQFASTAASPFRQLSKVQNVVSVKLPVIVGGTKLFILIICSCVFT